MTARIIRFPSRGPFSVRVEREEGAWLVICRRHGWLHGSWREAITEAAEIARGFGVVVVEARP
jgi:hypothetical protein